MGISLPIVPLRAVGVVLSLSIGGGGVDTVLLVEPVPHDPPSTFDEASEFEDMGPSVVRLSGFRREALV